MNPKWAFCFCDFETTGIAKESLPIEVGCIWTDYTFATIETYSQLTPWPSFKEDDHWKEEFMSAYDVHKIRWEEMWKEGKDVGDAAIHIHEVNQRLLKKYQRIILLSDNAKFETFHMEKMFEAAGLDWNFHYCTWDSSTLLEATGVGDPKPEHRAFRDAALLQVAMIKAMDRTRNLRDG